MKTFAFFVVVIVGFLALLRWQDWRESQIAESAPEKQSEVANSSPQSRVPNHPVSTQAGRSSPAAAAADSPEDAREFRVTIIQIVPAVGALAKGGFFRLNSLPPPTYRSPLQDRPGQTRSAEPTRGWTDVGDLFITGIPRGLADGEQFHGWLVRTGAKSLSIGDGKYRTVPAYRVVSKPAGIDATPKPGEWMYRDSRRPLDRQ